MVSLQAALVALALSGANQSVMLDFFSDTCGPCKAMEPTVQMLETKGYPVQRINVSRNPDLATRYQIHSVPCYVMIVDGREVDRVLGGTTLSRLERMCKLAQAAPSAPSEQSPSALAGNGSMDALPAGPSGSASLPAWEGTPPIVAPAAGVPADAMPLSAAPSSLSPFASLASAPDLASQALAPAASRASASAAPLAADSREPIAGWTPRTTADSQLIAASVRLRIEDPNGRSCGSGTIVDARGGEALVLTCGHIFRDSEGKGPIEVDLFGLDAAQAVPGRLVSFDLKRDVGLVSFRTPGPVTVARVAPSEYQIRPGDAVVTIGCNNGDRPSVRHSRINSRDKFVGPPNLQVAGQPVEGRSGGGLFSSDGLVIGVCNAADPEDQEGLYAALESIHAVLDGVGLAGVYRADAQNLASQPAAELPRAALVAIDPPPMPEQMPRTSRPDSPAELPLRQVSTSADGLPLRQVSTSSDGSSRLNAAEQAALEEIRQKLRSGAEVICVVRSRQDPAARSEVIMLDRVSPGFLRQLAAEALTESPRHLTSLEIPRKPTATPVGSGNQPSSVPSDRWTGSSDTVQASRGSAGIGIGR